MVCVRVCACVSVGVGVLDILHTVHPFLVTGLALVVVVFSLLPFVSLHLDRDSHLIIHPRLRGSRSHGTEKSCPIITFLPSW